LIEKPLSTSLDEVPRLREAVADRMVRIAYVLRVHPAVIKAKALVESGRLGPLLQVTVTSGQHFPTYRPAYREIYYANRKTGGGAVQDAATHSLNLIQSLAGRFEWIFCDYAHQALDGVEVEDTVQLTARTARGKVLVGLSLNQFMAPNETVVQLHGRDGSVKLHMHQHRFGTFLHGDESWTWSEPLVHERDDLFRRQASRFMSQEEIENPILSDLDDAEHTLRVNLAALESAGKLPIYLS
jgi:predicted dehydrogenase